LPPIKRHLWIGPTGRNDSIVLLLQLTQLDNRSMKNVTMTTTVGHDISPDRPESMLQALVSSRTTHAELTALLSNTEQDWFNVARCAADRLVLPSLYPLLQPLVGTNFLPEELVDLVEATFEANVLRNKTLLDDYASVSQILSTVDVPCIPLKGIALLVDDVYPELGERIVSDIDIAVPANHLPDALAALCQAGFLQVRNRFLVNSGNEPEFLPIDIDDFRNLPEFVSSHVPRIMHPSMLTTIELHIRVTMPNSPLTSWLDRMCFGGDCLELGGGCIERDENARALFHLMHNFEHTHLKDALAKSGIVDWRHLLDARHYLTNQASGTLPSAMMEVAIDHGLGAELAVHFWQLDALLGTPGVRELWERPEYTRAIKLFELKRQHRPVQKLAQISQRVLRVASRLRARSVLRERYGPIPVSSAIGNTLRFYLARAIGR